MIRSCAPLFNFFSAPSDGATTEYQISNRVKLYTHIFYSRQSENSKSLKISGIMMNVG